MEILPVILSKEITSEDDIPDLISDSVTIHDNDILIIAQKIISKQEGRLVKLDSVSPSLLAEGIASQYCKDPRIIELILSESKRIIRMENGILIVETNNGFVCANAGIDESNIQDGYASLLPINSDVSAKTIRTEISEKTGKNIAVIVADTFGRPFRMGQTNTAIGVSGINPILDYAGKQDTFGKTLRVTAIAIADELCSAAELIMEKTKQCPIVIIRNYDYLSENDSIDNLIRPDNEDLFR